MAAWNLQNKGKQTNRYREQTEGLWVEVRVGRGGRSGVLDGKGEGMKKCQLPAREMVAGVRGTARGMQSVRHAATAASGVGRGLNSPEGHFLRCVNVQSLRAARLKLMMIVYVNCN